MDADGRKRVLGLWIELNEGAKFWLKVMTELRNRGVNDLLLAVVDGLKGFPDATTAVFPQTQVQTCIVHMLRNIEKDWKMLPITWQTARNQFAILFGERFTEAAR